MKTVLLVVGKTTDKHFIASIEEYVKRVNRYIPFSICRPMSRLQRVR